MHLVTTKHRGVFVGTLKERINGQYGVEVVLTDARCVIYWSKETNGLLGLAAHGPAPGSRVTSSVPELHLQDVTATALCTSKAAEALACE